MIKGHYFDGKSSKKAVATLRIDNVGHYYFDNIEYATGNFSDLTISPRIANTARYIGLPGGAQFETLENDAVDTLVKQFSRRRSHGLVHRLENNKSTVIVSVLLVVVFTWAFLQFGVPHFSKSIAMMLPEEVSKSLGQGVLKVLDDQWLKETELDKKRQTELQALFVELVENTESPTHLKLELRKGGTLQANAFALPDGTIVFTDELINLAVDNREIAAVMLHEIGHISHRHSIRAVIQQFSVAVFVMAITGDVSTSSSVITAIPVLIVEAGFSQEMEWEADTYALNHMLTLNINPNYFADMMTKLAASHEKLCGDDCSNTNAKRDHTLYDYLSTHPPSEDRIDRFRRVGTTK